MPHILRRLAKRLTECDELDRSELALVELVGSPARSAKCPHRPYRFGENPAPALPYPSPLARSLTPPGAALARFPVYGSGLNVTRVGLLKLGQCVAMRRPCSEQCVVGVEGLRASNGFLPSTELADFDRLCF